MTATIVWMRRDLRLADNAALAAALDSGRSVLPLYIHAPGGEGEGATGAAGRAWLHHSLHALATALLRRGSTLCLAQGPALDVLRRLLGETGAMAVYWNRGSEPAEVERDRQVMQSLREAGVEVRSFAPGSLAEPWEIENRSGGPYRVFTPYWRVLATRLPTQPPLAAPASMPPPPVAPSLPLEALALRPRLGWDDGFWSEWTPGEAGAGERLAQFLDGPLHDYAGSRDRPDLDRTSRLSPHLHFGEISVRQVLHALRSRAPGTGAEAFVRQLGWREFARHLLYHFPQTTSQDLDPRFAQFRWADPAPAVLEAWRRGRTGVPLVDAGMRQLWHEGWMHNRVRMVVASFLCKHLRLHWRHGAAWFRDTLVDADLANNTMGWQWVAGTGADAAPYFRIFNPVTQSKRFDPHGHYLRRWLPELAAVEGDAVHAPWTSAAALARLGEGYPRAPLVDLATGRDAALQAYRASR